MSVFCSLCVFLFSAVSLVVPSGFSYGPTFLVLISLALLYVRPRISFRLYDWIFILTLAGYVLINVLLNIHHDLPRNAYDKLSRYLLVVPVYFLLISYPPKQSYFLWGLIFGGLGAAAIAVLQQFELFLKLIWPARSSGFLNPIQFGNISLLMAVLLLPFIVVFFKKSQKIKLITLMLLASFMGFLASFLSLSRGGWIAIPLVLLVLFSLFSVNIKKLLSLVLICCSIILFLCFLPQASSFRERINYTKIELNGLFQSDSYDVRTSAGSRMMMWKNGVEAFDNRPLLGWGDLSAIKSHFPLQWSELNKLDNYNHLHNEYIDALAKKGLVGFTALMAMYLIPLCYFVGLMRTRKADVMPFAAAGVVLILCVMVFGLTQCFLAHNSGTMVFVFYLVIIKAYCRNIVEARSLSVVQDQLARPPRSGK